MTTNNEEMMLRFVVISSLILCKIVSAHVALTFPPARKYDLDFLDTARLVIHLTLLLLTPYYLHIYK